MHLPYLEDESGLLEQVRAHLRARDGVSIAEVELDVLPEAGGVVVPDRLQKYPFYSQFERYSSSVFSINSTSLEKRLQRQISL